MQKLSRLEQKCVKENSAENERNIYQRYDFVSKIRHRISQFHRCRNTTR